MKTIQKYFLLLIVIFIIPSFVLAQKGKGKDRENRMEHKEKIEAQKVAFITDKLDLTTEEAEKFWPVYNANKDKIENERKEFKGEQSFTPEEIKEFSDDEALKFIQSQLDHEQRMLDMRSAFHNQLLDVLSAQKVLRLFKVEKEFRVELMHRVAGREKRMNRQRQ